MEGIYKKNVIVKPVLTEKSISYYRDFKVCTFWVNPKSTKKDIMFSFKQMYGVEPKSIRTLVTRIEKPNANRRSGNAKAVNRISRSIGKKAYIAIGENSLDVFENVK